MPASKHATLPEQFGTLSREAGGGVTDSKQHSGYGRSHGARGSFRRGRWWLVLIFCGLRGADALLYFGMPASGKSQLLAALVICSLWTTAAMAGVWNRKTWCRTALILLLVCSAGSFIFFTREALQTPLDYGMLGILLGVLGIYGAAVWGLASLNDIRRLRSQYYI
jgi:hypothetical protein